MTVPAHHRRLLCAAGTAALLLAGCASKTTGYGVDAQARAAATAPEPTAANRPDTQATYLGLVRQMQQGGLWFASLAHIDALERQWGETADSQLLRAHALRQTGRDADAVRAYQRLAGTPLEAAGLHGLGLLAGARGDYIQATRTLEDARRRSPTDAVLLSDLGYAYLRAGQKGQARLPLMQAAQLQPEDPRIQANLALYLLLDGKQADADKLMDSRRMPQALRTALADQVRQIDPAAPPAPRADTAAARLALSGSAEDLPLTLRPAWRIASPPAVPAPTP